MQNISKKEHKFLSGELEYWQDENIITNEQAVKILELYDIKKNNLRVIFLYAGILLLILGLASLAGAYWRVMPRFAKLCVVIVSYLAAVISYHFTGKRLLLLLSSVIVGAGIYLLSGLAWYNALLVQFVYVIIAAVLMHDDYQVYLAQAIALIYLNAINAIDIFALHFINLQKVPLIEFFRPYHAFIMLFALWLSCYKFRLAVIINLFITFLLFGSRLSLCTGGTNALIIIAITGVILSFIPVNDINIFGLLIAGMSGLMLTWPAIWRGEVYSDYSHICSLVCAVILALFMLVNIYLGHDVTGTLFFMMLACRYFLDNSLSYIARSIGFIFAGIIFLVFAYVKFFSKRQN